MANYTKHNGTWVGYLDTRTYHVGYPLDYALNPFIVSGGTNYAAYWEPQGWVDDLNKLVTEYPISGMYSYSAIQKGWIACNTGAGKGTTLCGQVLDKDGGIHMSICSDPGDSGGPLYSEVDQKAYGIMWGIPLGQGPCPSGTSLYTALSNALSDAHLNTGISYSPKLADPITSGIAGKCIDVNHAQQVDYTHVQIYSCNGTLAQRWSGLLRDGTLEWMDMCMDVYHGGTANYTKVDIYTCNGTGAQHWTYNSSTQTLVNPQSGKCLDDPGSSITDGTQLQIYTCDGAYAQRWMFSSS